MSLRMTWDGSKVLNEVSKKTERAVRAAANYVLDESRKQVPIDTGALSRSGAVSSEGNIAVVSYDTPYAIRWHEQQANFQRGRKNKYLEDPINDGTVRAKIMNYLQKEMKL